MVTKSLKSYKNLCGNDDRTQKSILVPKGTSNCTENSNKALGDDNADGKIPAPVRQKLETASATLFTSSPMLASSCKNKIQERGELPTSPTVPIFQTHPQNTASVAICPGGSARGEKIHVFRTLRIHNQLHLHAHESIDSMAGENLSTENINITYHTDSAHCSAKHWGHTEGLVLFLTTTW